MRMHNQDEPKDKELLEVEEVHDEAEQTEKASQLVTITEEYRLAGFWMRFWAYLLDWLIITSINGILIYPIFRALDIPINDSSYLSAAVIATALTFYLYFVLMTKYLGQTLGKMAFGLRVVQTDGGKLTWGTILFREWIGRFISGTVMMLPYLVVAFHPKKKGIHDLFADTTVVHER